MSDIFVTADTHLFHRNIIKYTQRPVDYTEEGMIEMNELIVSAMEETCKAGDTLFHLGDLYFGGMAKGHDVARMLARSACHKVLVLGNHDNIKSWPIEVIKSFDQILDAKILHKMRMEVLMTHRPMMIDQYWSGDIVNFHGHVHGITPNPPGRLDVGVDCAWRYFGTPRPFELSEAIRMALEDFPPTHEWTKNP